MMANTTIIHVLEWIEVPRHSFKKERSHNTQFELTQTNVCVNTVMTRWIQSLEKMCCSRSRV